MLDKQSFIEAADSTHLQSMHGSVHVASLGNQSEHNEFAGTAKLDADEMAKSEFEGQMRPDGQLLQSPDGLKEQDLG